MKEDKGKNRIKIHPYDHMIIEPINLLCIYMNSIYAYNLESTVSLETVIIKA